MVFSTVKNQMLSGVSRLQFVDNLPAAVLRAPVITFVISPLLDQNVLRCITGIRRWKTKLEPYTGNLKPE